MIIILIDEYMIYKHYKAANDYYFLDGEKSDQHFLEFVLQI